MTHPLPPDLTSRELAVLTGLARGHNRHQIATDSHLHPGTIANVQTRLARKLGTTSGLAAVLVDAGYRTRALADVAPEPRLPSDLSPTAVDVLRGYAAGRTDQSLRKRLFLTNRQLLAALEEITACLQPRNRAHAVALAHQGGHLTPAGATQAAA